MAAPRSTDPQHGLAAVVVSIAAVIGIGAWLVTCTDLPGRRLQVVLATPLALPSYVAGWAWIGWRSGLAGFAAALVLVTISYPDLPAGARRCAAPTPMLAGRPCVRRRPFTVFVTVTLRRSARRSPALLVALYVMSEFGAVTTMRYRDAHQRDLPSYGPASTARRRPLAAYWCSWRRCRWRWRCVGSAGRVDRAGPVSVARRCVPAGRSSGVGRGSRPVAGGVRCASVEPRALDRAGYVGDVVGRVRRARQHAVGGGARRWQRWWRSRLRCSPRHQGRLSSVSI